MVERRGEKKPKFDYTKRTIISRDEGLEWLLSDLKRDLDDYKALPPWYEVYLSLRDEYLNQHSSRGEGRIPKKVIAELERRAKEISSGGE